MVKSTKDMDSEEELKEAFKMFDEDGNGQITKEEFKKTLAKLGEKLTDEEVSKLI